MIKCPHCKINRKESEFHKDKNSKTGYKWWCKYCANKYCRNNYKNGSIKIINDTKKCIDCGETKLIDEFPLRKDSPDGHRNWCKACRKISRKEHHIKNREHDNQCNLNFNKNHRVERRKYMKNKLKTDNSYHILAKTRRRIGLVLEGFTKSMPTIKLLGYENYDDIKNKYLPYLQKTADYRYGVGVFDINNYDHDKFQIHHKVPCDLFNIKCSYHQKLCFHYTNTEILNLDDHSKTYGKRHDISDIVF